MSPASVLLGLGLGTGLLLVIQSFSPRREKPPRIGSKKPHPIRRVLDEAGHHRLPVSALIVAMTAAGLLAFLTVLLITSVPAIAACFGLFAVAAPYALVLWQAKRRQRSLAGVWPDVVDHLRSAIRSGLSLPEGLMELGRNGPEPLREPFTEFGDDWRAGMTLEHALERLRNRLADPVGDRIVLALNITRELGGTDLGRLLNTLAEVLRENTRTRSELEARQSWTVTGARVAVAAPWIVVLMLATRPEAAAAYREPTGVGVLAAGLAVSVLCYWTMLRIGALPRQERVLV
ncbi:type II secretion system protein F [Nesterenkonia sp. MY13]|uniref:Type II secretion system protein F n=1 Tax=Nesterenkonia sedimenti TaxID=1463632 RepID=A0A7X8TMB2_9MICC|nr:type II secretion system F family protein [Nesterenkonia sedimenti]NLS11209.1 type II secretion system protein F [Nesterenkonia sedimenti]